MHIEKGKSKRGIRLENMINMQMRKHLGVRARVLNIGRRTT